LEDDILSQQVVFTTKDILNIVSWFEKIYSEKDNQMRNDERETYLKLAKYFVIEKRVLN